MTFSHTTTGATQRSTIFRGDIAYISGTWRSIGTKSGTIITGGSVILAHEVIVGSAILAGTATRGSSSVLSSINKASNGDTLNGAIRIHQIDTTNEITGDWWAVTRL